jgi:hypothetical protein
MTTLPSNVGYGTVVGRFLLAYADGLDLDVFPDGAPCRGTVLLTPSAPYVKNVTASPNPVTILPATIECPLDSEGYLLGPDNTRGVRLVATNDADNNPVDWTWRVDFRLTDQLDSPTRGIPTFHFQLPIGQTIDLTTVSPVPDANGVYYLTGPTGATGAQGPSGTVSVSSPITNSGTSTAAVLGFNWASTVLDSIGDVSVTSPNNQDMIKYNTSTSLWEKSNTIDGGTA